MAGVRNQKAKLDRTLKKIASILKEHDIKNWFVSYGTLLGITRENGCIDGDDDVDIVSNINDYEKIKSALAQNGFTFYYGSGIGSSRSILKTNDTEEYSSVDFYMSVVEGDDFVDHWERVRWAKCKPLISKEWNGVQIWLPQDAESKLIGRYGEEWRIPQNTKGPDPRKTILR